MGELGLAWADGGGHLYFFSFVVSGLWGPLAHGPISKHARGVWMCQKNHIEKCAPDQKNKHVLFTVFIDVVCPRISVLMH